MMENNRKPPFFCQQEISDVIVLFSFFCSLFLFHSYYINFVSRFVWCVHVRARFGILNARRPKLCAKVSAPLWCSFRLVITQVKSMCLNESLAWWCCFFCKVLDQVRWKIVSIFESSVCEWHFFWGYNKKYRIT